MLNFLTNFDFANKFKNNILDYDSVIRMKVIEKLKQENYECSTKYEKRQKSLKENRIKNQLN